MARSVNPDIDADKGYKMLKDAISLNPENAWAHQTLATLKLHEGDIQTALEHAELAVIENPANPDNLTFLSVCLAHAGDWDRALPLAQEALDRNPDPPAIYYYSFFLKALHDNDVEAMTSTAKVFTMKKNYYAKLYSYLAAIASGDETLAKELKPHIDTLAKRNDGDIMTVIAARMPSDDLQQKARRLLAKGEALLADIDG